MPQPIHAKGVHPMMYSAVPCNEDPPLSQEFEPPAPAFPPSSSHPPMDNAPVHHKVTPSLTPPPTLLSENNASSYAETMKVQLRGENISIVTNFISFLNYTTLSTESNPSVRMFDDVGNARYFIGKMNEGICAKKDATRILDHSVHSVSTMNKCH